MSEEWYEIEWTTVKTHRSAFTRKDIEDRAEARILTTPELMTACRKWLAANPQGMTPEQFDSLPDGSVVALDGTTEYIKVGNRLGFTNHGDCVTWFLLDGQSLPDMTVVSTPPAPTLDEVHHLLVDGGDYWRRINTLEWRGPNGAIRTTEHLRTRPDLTPLIPGPQIGGEACPD